MLDVRVLGPVEVVRAGRRVALSPKQRDLVALLAARWPEPVAADRIEDELWAGEPPATARKVVQKYVSQLRASLGAGHISWTQDGYAFRDISLDAASFATAGERMQLDDAEQASVQLTDVLGLWRGEPYAGVDLVAIEPERVRLSELRLLAIHRQVEAELRLGRHAALVGRLERLVCEYPYCEALWGQLIRALYGAGRQSDALRAYRRVRDHLVEELGVEPSVELRMLEQQVLRHDPVLSVTPSPAQDPVAHGQRRIITVVALAIDADCTDPEDRARMAQGQLDIVRRVCEHVGGRIESAIGGRIVIGFGVPALGDDADRAVNVAHRLVSGFERARAGVATGWALVQPSAVQEARVVGEVVDAAWEAVASAPLGEVVVDEPTRRACAGPAPDLPYVGRTAELAVLQDHVGRLLAGEGPQLVSTVGEGGVGKTRLVAELRHRSPDGLQWLITDCLDGAALSEPLRALADERMLDDLVTDRAEREWLRAVIVRGVAAERTEVVAACTTLLAALARAQPTVVVFEDIHRADQMFPVLLADCLDQLRRVPLLAITTSRPTTSPALGRHLPLRSLEPADVDELLRHLLPASTVSGAQRRALVTRSAGNPLYAIQFARMVEQHGWDGSVPATVRSLIAARLDLLDPVEAELIVAGAVAGHGFDAEQLAEMLDLSNAVAAPAVGRLLATGLLERATGHELRLCHDLVQDVAYERLPRPRRVRLNEAAALTIERRAGDCLPVHAMRVAQHLGAAATAAKEMGGDESTFRRRAFDLMMLAGDSLGEKPDGRFGLPIPADHAEVDRFRADVMVRRGEFRAAAAAADRGLTTAVAAGDRVSEARLRALTGHIHWLRGDTPACVEALESARRLVSELPPGRALLDAISYLAFVTALLGRTGEAIDLAEQGLLLAKEHVAPDKEIRCLNARGAGRLLEGDLNGYVDFTTALARALESGLSHESAMAYHNLGELHWQGEGPARGLELIGRGLELAERRGLTVAADWLRANRIAVCFDAGRWDEALALTEVVVSQETSSGEGQAGTMSAIVAARIHVWRGNLETAQRLQRFFLPRARRCAVTQQLGPALVVAGLVEAATGHPSRAADLAAEFCNLTETTREYRHMELTDTVRLLLVDGRVDEAAAAHASRVIPTIRNECQSATATAALAIARADPDATAMSAEAAERWHTFGHPLEEHLAWIAAGSPRDAPCHLSVDARVIRRLLPVPSYAL